MAATAAEHRTLSAREYAGLREPDDVRSELVRGRLVREPRPGSRHARVQAELARQLGNHVREGRLGAVFTDVGVVLAHEPPTVRGPDVAFVSTVRLPDAEDDGFLACVPDLVVEIVSPSNRATQLQEKVIEYLGAGARLVWIVDPGAGTVTVYRSLRDAHILRDTDTLEGGDVLPELRIPIAELLSG